MKNKLSRDGTLKVIHDHFMNEIRKTASEASEEYGDRIYTDTDRVEELLTYNRHIHLETLSLTVDENGEIDTAEVLKLVSHYFFETIIRVLAEPDENSRMVYHKVTDCLEQDLNLEAAIEKFAKEEERTK